MNALPQFSGILEETIEMGCELLVACRKCCWSHTVPAVAVLHFDSRTKVLNVRRVS